MGWLGSLELDHGQLCFSELDRGWLGFPELDRRLGFPELDHGLGDGGHKKTTQTTTIVLSKHEKQRAGTLPAQVQDASPRTAFVMPSVTKKRPSAARTFLSQALTSDRPEPLVPLMASCLGDAPHKMRPRPARHGDLPPDVQHRRLPRFVRGSVEALTDNMLQAIAQGLPEDGKLTFGTACSGSEFYLTSLPLVASCLSEKLGRPITFVHKWSCEIDPAKRQWILDNFAPPKLFADVTKLASGPCRDFVSGSDQEVDDVDIIIAGTSCKDASRLNPHHANRLNAVDSASHTTGSTFQGLAALVANMGLRCRLVFLENVASLRDVDKTTGRSNLDGVADTLRSMGFHFICLEFCASDLGLPVARPRLYMAGVRCPTEGSAQREACHFVETISRNAEKHALDAMLLPEREPYDMMSNWMPEGIFKLGAASRRGEAEGRWRQKHKENWALVPTAIRDEVLRSMRGNIWYEALPDRQQDLLLLLLSRCQMARRLPATLSLDRSLEWQEEPKDSQGSLPTLVPSAVLWLCARRRLLLGVEAVMLQGVDLSDLRSLSPGSHESGFLQNLAGNAFCVYQFVPWLLACLVVGSPPSAVGSLPSAEVSASASSTDNARKRIRSVR